MLGCISILDTLHVDWWVIVVNVAKHPITKAEVELREEFRLSKTCPKGSRIEWGVIMTMVTDQTRNAVWQNLLDAERYVPILRGACG